MRARTKRTIGAAGVVILVGSLGSACDENLIHKLEGRDGIQGQRMPRTGGPYLTAGQMRVLKRWIEIGAPR